MYLFQLLENVDLVHQVGEHTFQVDPVQLIAPLAGNAWPR